MVSLCLPQPKILPPPKYKGVLLVCLVGVFVCLFVFARWTLTISHLFLTHAQMLDQFEIFILVIIKLVESEASSAVDIWTPDFLHSGRGRRTVGTTALASYLPHWLHTFLLPAHSYWENLTVARSFIISSKETQMKGEMKNGNYCSFWEC